MRILIVGSNRHLPEDSDKRKEFERACRSIGKVLAESKVDIVVGTDRETSADRYIVEGVANAQADSKSKGELPTVWISRPESGPTPFDYEPKYLTAVRFRFQRSAGPWTAGRVPQIMGTDAVILIGGGDGTFATGHIALALNKPVLLIPYFEGAAEKLWSVFEAYYKALGDGMDEISTLREKWQSQNADLVLTSAKRLIASRVFDVRPRVPMGLLLVCLIGCLALWTWLFAQTPYVTQHIPSTYAYFLMLSIAGTLGTILRTSLRLIKDPTAKFSWNQLLLELSAGLLLGFALALFLLVGSITISGKADALSGAVTDASSDFRRVSVIMTLLGLGGGLALEQASERVSRWFDQQFKSDLEKNSLGK